MKQKFIAALYFVFAAFTTNAMAQTPPPGTIPLATAELFTQPPAKLHLDGDRIAIETISSGSGSGVDVIEKLAGSWSPVPVAPLLGNGPIGEIVVFEGNRFATNRNGRSQYQGPPPPVVWERTVAGWGPKSILVNDLDIVCAGFSPYGVVTLVPELVQPQGYAVIRNYSCIGGQPKVTSTLPVPPIPNPGLFGMALSGDTLVTVYSRRDNVLPKLHVYIYERIRGTGGAIWTLRGELPLPVSLASSPIAFSPALATDGNTIALGVPRESMPVPGLGTVEAGAVYVFGRTTTGWELKSRLIHPRNIRYFGTAVAVSGDRLLVGSESHQVFDVLLEPGEAYLFQRINGTWNPTPNVLKATSTDINFGRLVALQGNTAAVSNAISAAGEVFIYTLPSLPLPGVQEIVLDNLAAGLKETVGVGTVPGWRTFTGTWCNSIAADFFGTKSLYSCGGTADSYRWTPNIKTAGKYDVYVWYATNANRSTNVPITVASTKTPVTKIYNERTGGGRWILHGRYTFAAGQTGYVEVRAANGQAGADAVRFVSVP